MADRRYALLGHTHDVSAGEVNDLTAAVTWDNIPIANVPTGTSGVTVALGNHTHVIANVTDFTDNSTNWDTAYGWGDHSTQNYAYTTGDTFTGAVTFNGGVTIDSSGTEALSITRSGSAALTIGNSGSGDLALTHSGAGDITIDGAIVSSTLIGQWNTAYGWGDHGAIGYIESITGGVGVDVTGTTAATLTLDLSELSSTITAADADAFIVLNAAKAQKQIPASSINVSGFNNDAGYLTTGGGDVYKSSPIALNSIAVWDNAGTPSLIGPSALSWSGTDLGVTGTITATGVVSATSGTSTDWNTAYGWGDHASAGYQDLRSYFKKFQQTVSVTAAATVSAAAELLDINGASYNLTGKHELLVRGYIGAETGTDTAVFGRFYQDGGAWTMEEFDYTAGSNNPRIGLTTGGLPGIYHDHASTYNVQVEIEETTNRTKFGEWYAGRAPLASPTFTGTVNAATVDVTSNVLSPKISLDAGSGNGIRFWGTGDPYRIVMAPYSDATYGGRIDSTSDYNMYFSMTSGTNRGFVFQSALTETFSINPDGVYSNVDIKANANIVGDGATTISGVETITIDQTGDITKSGEGNYLYHKSSSYSSDQQGGVTFSTSSASGGNNGDIWFKYT